MEPTTFCSLARGANLKLYFHGERVVGLLTGVLRKKNGKKAKEELNTFFSLRIHFVV